MKYAFIGLAFLVFVGSSEAADLRLDSMEPCFGQPCVEATGKVWLRDSPPSGLFYSKGEKLDVVEASEILVVEQQKTVKTLFQKYEWLKVKRISHKSDGSQIEPKVAEGWVYNGKMDGIPYFEVVKNNPIPK